MLREQLPYHPTSTFVIPQWESMYVAVNKAACTSVKWLLADLQGERRERFYGSISSEVSRAMTIHRRNLWQKTPMATDLSDDELAAISPDNGWFVFTVVRHPTARLFSAWQSKLLLREPWWANKLGDAEWFPRIPESSDDIVDDFVRFVRAIVRDPGLVIPNRHFAPQHRMVAWKRMRYTRIYRTSELDELLEDFADHLRERGWHGERLALERSNAAPLPAIPAMFVPEVLDASRSLYRLDYEVLGYEDAMPDEVRPLDSYSDVAVAEVRRLIERAERIGDLSRRARALRARTLARPTPAPPAAPGALRKVAWRMRRRILGR